MLIEIADTKNKRINLKIFVNKKNPKNFPKNRKKQKVLQRQPKKGYQ